MEVDLENAVRLYKLAAEAGYPPAQCNLGWCYEAGQGVEQSWPEAIHWYTVAAEAGYPRAQCNLVL